MQLTKVEREVTEEINLSDDMPSSLVDLLIEKGVITEEEYEKRIKEKIKVKQSTFRGLCALLLLCRMLERTRGEGNVFV